MTLAFSEWWSWSKFAFVEWEFWLSKFIKSKFICYWGSCDRLNLRKKLVGLHFLVVCAYEISRRTRIFFHKFAFDKKCWKHSSNFESGKIVLSSNFVEFEFELCHIPSCISIFSLFSQCCLSKITTMHVKLLKVMHKIYSRPLISSS